MDESMKKSMQDFINSLSLEEIEEGNRHDIEETEALYKEFKEKFHKGLCSLCNNSLDSYNKESPCLHWMLRRTYIKKKVYKGLFNLVGYFRLNAYLRWVANQDGFMRNINDLKEEKNEAKLIEHTIVYRNLEWSFSCSFEDYKGHENKLCNFPHFHLQMRIDNNQFINFNDFHIPFSENDVFGLEMINNFGAIESYGSGGVGLNEGFNLDPEDIINFSSSPDDENKATYHISTMASFKNSISGEEIIKLYEESKKTGKTLTRLIQEYGGEVSSIITPHESLPEIAKRSGRGKT